MKPPYFLFDIGATQTRVGVSFDGTHIENNQIYPTPPDFTEGVTTLAKKAHELGQEKAQVLVGGIAGPLNKEKSMITAAPNLGGWNNKPFAEELVRLTNSKVFLENDTALVGLGEAVYGAGKGVNIVAYMTVSTGVNGVRIVNQKIDENALGFEIGSQIVDLDKSYDQQSSDFEDLVSGANFKRRFGSEAHETQDSNVWNEVAKLVAYGLNNLIVFWSPEVIVLGGSVAKSIPIQEIVVNLEKNLTIFSELPPIKPAELVDFGGLWGALHWANSL